MVASKVSDAAVVAVMESNADLKGVEIQQQTSRVYEDTYILKKYELPTYLLVTRF